MTADFSGRMSYRRIQCLYDELFPKGRDRSYFKSLYVPELTDAIIDELGDVAQAMLALDQSYTIDFPLLIAVHAATTSSASDSAFIDALTYTDCTRATGPTGQVPQPVEDTDS